MKDNNYFYLQCIYNISAKINCYVLVFKSHVLLIRLNKVYMVNLKKIII
jgi:hypothetical protein